MKNPLKYLRKDYIPWAFWPISFIATFLGLTLGLLFYSVEVGALVFTAIFIAWYSIETSKLVKETKNANALASATRKEMTLANQLSIQPALVLEYTDGPPWFFNLKNIGKGSAINIKIESNRPEFSFELKGLNAMRDGNEKEVVLLRNGQDLTTEDWKSLETNPVIAKILFERTKKFKGKTVMLKTKIEIRNPSNTRILERQWIPR